MQSCAEDAESGDERAAVQTLREVRRLPEGAKRLEYAWL
jgi:hypothetical protein